LSAADAAGQASLDGVAAFSHFLAVDVTVVGFVSVAAAGVSEVRATALRSNTPPSLSATLFTAPAPRDVGVFRPLGVATVAPSVRNDLGFVTLFERVVVSVQCME
jgi:hypothetical protein